MTETQIQPFKILMKRSKSMKQRIEVLAESSIMSDFKFIVGPDKIEVPAHKFIFSATSFEFYNLFFLSAPTDTNIYLEEIKYESFKEFIRYVYSDDIKIKCENYFDILKLSLRYDIEHLTNLCLKKLPKLIQEEVNDVFTGSFMEYFDVWIRDKNADIYLSILGLKPLDFINHENVKKLKWGHLSVILKCEDTQTSEINFFKLAMMWAEKQCILNKILPSPSNKRVHLQDLFFLIRFPTMTLDEFRQCSSDQNGLFSNEEMFKIISIINGDSSVETAFCSRKRVGEETQNSERTVKRSRLNYMMANITPEKRSYVGGSTPPFQFKQQTHNNFFVKKSILLHGINILIDREISICSRAKYILNFVIFVSGGNITSLHSHTFKLEIPTTFSQRYLEEIIQFKNPLKLEASRETYNISVEAICSEKKSPDFKFPCTFLFNTPARELVALNPDVCEYATSYFDQTAISNILFTMTKIELFIKSPGGRRFNVEVDPFCTTEMLKEAIYEARRYSISEMLLFFEMTLLEDLENIQKYQIKHNSVLDLHLRK